MTANQLTMLAVRRAARALRRVHSEQVLMWEGFWRANRFPQNHSGSGLAA